MRPAMIKEGSVCSCLLKPSAIFWSAACFVMRVAAHHAPLRVLN
jgi:hypothetical protein